MIDFENLYRQFDASISEFDCGDFCAPHNERGVPFCCDIRFAVPSAYLDEWEYLKNHTYLWKPWVTESSELETSLRQQIPQGQVLIACLGHEHCQRDFRSITCRAFPFFPYVTLKGEFIGLSYYWEFEEYCWVISHLDVVTNEYRSEFLQVFDYLIKEFPEEREIYRNFSIMMRRSFGRKHRTIPLLHRNGNAYKISPGTGKMRKWDIHKFPKFGPYKIADELPFPDEIQVLKR